MRRWRVLGVVALAVGCASMRTAESTAESQGIAPPAAAYLQCCASCHGRDGRGDGPVAASLKTRPADLTRLAATHGGRLPRDEILATVVGTRPVPAHGPREMPVWALRFEPSGQAASGIAAAYAQRRLDAILAYVEAQQVP